MRFRATSTWFMGVTVGYTSYSLACRLTTRYKACLLNDIISVVSPFNQPSTTRYPFGEREKRGGGDPQIHFEVNKLYFLRVRWRSEASPSDAAHEKGGIPHAIRTFTLSHLIDRARSLAFEFGAFRSDYSVETFFVQLSSILVDPLSFLC